MRNHVLSSVLLFVSFNVSNTYKEKIKNNKINYLSNSHYLVGMNINYIKSMINGNFLT